MENKAAGGGGGGGALFTRTGEFASGGFSAPLAVLLAHALLGALKHVPFVAGKLHFGSLQIGGAHFGPVCWRWNKPTRHHCVVEKQNGVKTRNGHSVQEMLNFTRLLVKPSGERGDSGKRLW